MQQPVMQLWQADDGKLGLVVCNYNAHESVTFGVGLDVSSLELALPIVRVRTQLGVETAEPWVVQSVGNLQEADAGLMQGGLAWERGGALRLSKTLPPLTAALVEVTAARAY